MAASFTLFAMGPAVSIFLISGKIPSPDMLSLVGLNPTTELAEDGATIEPSVSVPTETGTRSAVTATALPLLEPEGDIFSGPNGLTVCPLFPLYPDGITLDT